MLDPTLIEVREASAIGEARRGASRLAAHAGLDDDGVARLALVLTELGTNLLKHAGGGRMLFGVSEHDARTIELLVLDGGPGIGNLAEALRDGHSTSGTPGNGLGAVSRHANLFQIYSQPGTGTAVLVRMTGSATERLDPVATGGVSIPFPGETVNGDGWCEAFVDHRRRILVVDGLGHGHAAHDAAVAASRAFAGAGGAVTDVLMIIHDALRGTRGAAVAVAELDGAAGLVRFSGAGNISATIVDASARRSAVSQYGIVGHQMREAREYTYPWTPESTLIMHSDGLTTRWDLDRYPGLLGRDAVLIAAVLWNGHHRPNDDSTVVVAQAR